ncbi:MAG: CARDB domain-containing protein, partial [Euryarchaeota archaeon]
MKKIALIILATLLLPGMSHVVATSGRASNIDLAVGDISITYTDSTNRSKYQMFSSNYPIIGFSKPQNLYVTDGVLGVEMNINIEIENLGTSQSGFIDVQVYVLHNEYTRFELLNYTTGMSPIAGSASSSTDVLWIPQYSGNHTLQVIVSNSAGDDDTNNNQKNRHMTIAYSYDNCEDMSLWASSGEWKVSSDVFITSPSAFHIGNGEFSTYSSSQTSTLTTPVMNLADDVNGHKAAIGYSFFYTGGANTGDMLTGYALDDNGNWDQTFNLQNVVDNNFQDGSNNWQTFTASFNNKNSPLIPLGNEHFHANSQFRFTFTSDGSAEDIGYYFDEFVIIYDQAARKSEFNIDLSGVNTIGGLPGDWSITRLSMENTGNISARYTPEVFGVPEGWTYYFSNTNGANIGSSGLEILPGETKIFDLRVMVDENASQGNIPVTVNVTSNTHSDIQDSITTSVKVLPSRVPDLIVPEFTPRCKPGQTCMFPVELRNIGEATDVFNISIEDKNVPTGWTISLSWNQSTAILVRTDSPQNVWLTATVPQGIEPDVTAEVYLTATSTNDTRRSDTEVIDVAAAMTSQGAISSEEVASIDIDAGSYVDISFRVYNNASRIDIFKPMVSHTDVPGWEVNLLNTPDMAISPGSSSIFKVRVVSPTTAQAGDMGPIISPKVLSLRSGEEIIGDAWQGIKVTSYRNITLELIDYPTSLTPGIPININLKVSNYGNGDDTAELSLPWSPSTWTWWALSDGVNVTETIPLSAPYDLENEKIINMWLLLDPLEAPGEIHEIAIEANSINEDDISPGDNSVMFEAVTEVIKQPKLDGYFGEIVAETNSSYKFNAVAWNIGNSFDSTLRSKLLIQTSPPTQCVIGFIETDSGLSKASNEWMMLNLGPTQSTNITM